MTGDPDLVALRELIAELDDVTGHLRDAGEDIPAIERNAMRIEAVIRILEQHVPPELEDD